MDFLLHSFLFDKLTFSSKAFSGIATQLQRNSCSSDLKRATERITATNVFSRNFHTIVSSNIRNFVCWTFLLSCAPGCFSCFIGMLLSAMCKLYAITLLHERFIARVTLGPNVETALLSSLHLAIACSLLTKTNCKMLKQKTMFTRSVRLFFSLHYLAQWRKKWRQKSYISWCSGIFRCYKMSRPEWRENVMAFPTGDIAFSSTTQPRCSQCRFPHQKK